MAEYQLLSTDDQMEHVTQTSGTDKRPPFRYMFLLAVCAVITIINCVVLAATVDSILPQPLDPTILPRPNQYIGLDAINWSTSEAETLAPLINYPTILGQISVNDHARILHVDMHSWFSARGTVYTEDRHFLIDNLTSTIFQTRVRDFGMESCKIVFHVPTSRTEVDSPEFSIDIWRLESGRVLDTSYPVIVPSRTQLLATVTLSAANQVATTESFKCASDSLQLFEFSCGGFSGGCRVEFWQNRRKPEHGGVYMRQTTSL